MSQKHLIADLSSFSPEPIKLAYIDQPASDGAAAKGTILLIHGFPQTSYQFRHALPLLSARGYRCIVPDYRGAGNSSKDVTDFRKSTMAADMVALLDYLGLKESVHVVGHDIGGMIAAPLAARWPERVQSVLWGECPLPGTQKYFRDRTESPVHFFHLIFHEVPDLPEALVAGKERTYVEHFLQKLTYNIGAFSEADLDHYGKAYAQPGAMRCAAGVYRAFKTDAEENEEWVSKHGKSKVPTMILSGDRSRLRIGANEMASEVTDRDVVDIGEVEDSGHYCAEENPQGFVKVVVDFLERRK